jgi:hypothetical protein
VDFCLSLDGALTTLVEYKLGDVSPHRDVRQVEHHHTCLGVVGSAGGMMVRRQRQI